MKQFFKKCARKVDPKKTFKSWVFTINNYDDDDLQILEGLCDNNEVSKMTVGIEQGEKGTIHLQGAVTFRKAKRFAAMKKIHGTAHWEVMICIKGDQAFEYCRKDGEVVIEWDNKEQGKRNDLDLVQEAILEKKSKKYLWEHHWGSMVRYHRGIETGMRVLMQDVKQSNYKLEDFPRTWREYDKKKSWIYWGESGIGKTQFALAQFKAPLKVRDMDDLGDLDPDMHDGIVFDDVDFRHWPRTSQIHILDYERTSVRIRYKTVTIPKGFPRVFTTNEPGGRIFKDEVAINRRFESIELRDFPKG